MAPAICVSLVFHLLTVLILTTTSTYYPALGNLQQFDIFWVHPATIPLVTAASAQANPPTEPQLRRETVLPKLRQPLERGTPGLAPAPSVPDPDPDPAEPAAAPDAQPGQDEPQTGEVAAPMVEPRQAPPMVEPRKGAPMAEPRQGALRDDRGHPVRHKAEQPSVRTLPRKEAPAPAEGGLKARPELLPAFQERDSTARIKNTDLGGTEAETIAVPEAPQPGQEERKRPAARLEVPEAASEKTEPAKSEGASERAPRAREQDERDRQAASAPVSEQIKLGAAQGEKHPEPARQAQKRQQPEAEAARDRQEQRDRQTLRHRQEQRERESIERKRIAAARQEAVAKRKKAAPLERKSPQTRLWAAHREPPAIAAAASSPAVARQQSQEGAPSQNPKAPVPAIGSAPAGDRPELTDRTQAGFAAVGQVATRPSEKKPQARGLVIASPRGDLKLVITGDTGIKLSVRFREYPKSRRNRVPSRSELRREQTVTPIVADTGEDRREAVIETAREGIYVFSAEPERGKGVKASFTLKIFESGTKERIAPLGARTVSGSTVLLKILMPEGILWDDEDAFTGNLEDSESETKFNAATGLYWKEFHD